MTSQSKKTFLFADIHFGREKKRKDRQKIREHEVFRVLLLILIFHDHELV